jgi:hypothetical protein
VKNKSRLLALSLISLFAFGLLCTASAGTANTASVWTTDVNNVKMNQFNVGQTVWIWWHVSPLGTTVDITVVDQNNVVMLGPLVNQVVGNQPIVFVPPAAGYYTVLANGQPAFVIATATFFAVPESVFGTIAALGAGFAAFGLLRWKMKKPTI